MKRIAALAALIFGATTMVIAPATALASTSTPAGVPRCPIAIGPSSVSAAIPGCMRSFTFNLPARSTWATEVKGPQLLLFDEIYYQGHTYRVAAVHGDRFRLELRSRLFATGSRALYHAVAYIDSSGETRI
jgi:hypothetical protein